MIYESLFYIDFKRYTGERFILLCNFETLLRMDFSKDGNYEKHKPRLKQPRQS